METKCLIKKEIVTQLFSFLIKRGGSMGNSPFAFTAYKEVSKARLSGLQHPLLFVLQGTLRCSFTSHSSCDIVAPTLFVVDMYQVNCIVCSKNTLLLEYTPTEGTAKILQMVMKRFKRHCSELIPIDNRLLEWCSALFKTHTSEVIMDESLLAQYRRRLNDILMKFQISQLGILYVPLKVFEIRNSKKR